MRLRVKFITAYTIEAGTYFRSHNLARALVRRGHDVVVSAVDPDAGAISRTEFRDEVRYEVIPDSRHASRFGSASHPVTALRRVWAPSGAWDVIHLFQPFLSQALPWYASRGRALRVYDWDDLWWGGALAANADSFPAAWLNFWVRWLERRLPQQADLVTTCSEFLATRARARNARQTLVIHNGFWPAPGRDRGTARAKLGLAPDALYAGFMGRTADELQWCTAALGETAAVQPNVRFAACGFPEFLLDALAPDLRARVDYLGVLSPAETRGFAAAIDIGLLPLADTPFNQSRFPIKFAEYLGARVPVLMSDVGECAWLAKSWPWVERVAAGEQAFQTGLVAMMRRVAIGQAPRVDTEIVAQALSWEHLGARLEASYVEAINARPTSRP